MGKYSLESFEKYPMVRCRPQEKRDGVGSGAFQTVRLEIGQPLPPWAGKTLLEIRITERDLDDLPRTESALRSLAGQAGRNPLLLGVTLSCGTDSEKLCRLRETAAESFRPARYYVPVTDGAQLDHALGRGFLGGLLAVIGDSALDTCEAFAAQRAQRLYRRFPVLVRREGGEKNATQYAAQWHALAAENIPDAQAGFRIALRRLHFPKILSSGGYAPLRFWWTNRGPSCCHGETEVRLRLEKDGRYTPLPLRDRPQVIPLADRVHNEIVRLPRLETGVYRLEYGLFTREGEALELCHEGRTADGYYPASDVRIDDQPRPEYGHIWDDYYPDGYYPLEDPKVPGT